VSEEAGIESKTDALAVRCSEQMAKNIIKWFFDRRSTLIKKENKTFLIYKKKWDGVQSHI
jgi:hypothetical protein